MRAADQAARMKLSALQIFSGNPRGWQRKPLDPETAVRFRTATARAGLDPVVVHASYLLNLASDDRRLWTRSVDGLAEELDRARELGASAVVVHPGSRGHRPLEWGIDRVARGAARALEKAGEGCALWLENTAGGGGQMGGTLSQLRLMLDRLKGLPVGVCLDTAHAWGAGYHLDQADGVHRFLDQVGAVLGLKRVKLWHFNDSDRQRGSKADRHTHLGRGLLGAQGLGALVRDPRLARGAFIMETPKNSRWADRRNLAYFLHLLDGVQRPIG